MLCEGEMLSMLASLSLSRQRRFMYMIEDECLNLIAANHRSRGLVINLTLPPLSQNLRELVSVTTQRFLLRDSVLPEGDVEKPMALSIRPISRVPCILYSDLVPSHCPLLQHALHGPPPEVEPSTLRAGSEEGVGGKLVETTQDEISLPLPSSASVSSSACRGRARPAMGVYRPRRMMESREDASQQHAEQQQKHREQHQLSGERMSATVEGDVEAGKSVDYEAAACKTTTQEVWEDQGGVEECSLLHDYKDYRQDLTPKAWGEQTKRTPYVEFESGDGKGDNWRFDEAWQLRGDNNGTISFCVQAGSFQRSATVLLGLAGEREGACTCVVTLDPVGRAVLIERKEGRDVVARVAGQGETMTNKAVSGRPPPEKFWVVVRHGLVAVGYGAHVGVSKTLAALSCDAPEKPWRHVAFSPGRVRTEPLTIFRIGMGGKVCTRVASIAHLRMVRSQSCFAECVRDHLQLSQRLRSRHSPPRGYVAWRAMPSCVAWAPPSKPKDGLLGQLLSGGVRVVASSQDWGWLLLPSLDQDAAMRNLVLAGKGEWLPSMIEWEGEKLTASGIPVVRERPASSPAAANRLISSALRPSPAKRGKAGESAARERDSGKGYMDRSDLGASKR